MTSQEIAKPDNAPRVFNDDVLSAVKSFDDVRSLFDAAGVGVESMEDYGTGFKVTDKSKLVNVSLMILEWRFNDGDFGDSGFVSVAAVTRNGDKVIFNDGSTGIYRQLRRVTDQRQARNHPTPQAGLLVEGGLTRSDYETEVPGKDGKPVRTPATTFYLAE